MGIQGREYSIGQILNSAAGKVEVPPHQRPYSWENAELKELWEDLMSFSDNLSGKTPEGKQYFLGSIVGLEKPEERSLEVLDGQQRLATITIALATIRDLLHEAGRQDLAQKVNIGQIVASSKMLDAPPEYVLKLGRVDDGFFRFTVLAYPPEEQKNIQAKTASQQAILRAKKFFRSQIIAHGESHGLALSAVALRLHHVVINQLTVVRVSSEAFDDVTDVFERLNDRGKGLSTLDLLRVYLIGKSPKQAQADVEEAWATVYELSQSATKVDAFLRHSWITHRGDVKSRSLYKEIKAVLDSPDQPAPLNNTVQFSQSLAQDAELYRKMVEGKHPDDRCSYWLRAIGTLGASNLWPAALAGSAVWANVPDYTNYATLLQRLVSTFVRWNVISGGESTVLEEAAFRVARIVRAGGGVEEASALLRPYLQEDEAIVRSFQRLSVVRPGYQRYVLEALEDWYANPKSSMPPEKPVSDAKTLWIEHVYPQSPDKHWGRWVKHDEYLNRLGNLTLIHKRVNAAMKNGDFAAKKARYRESGLLLNGYFEGVDSFSPQVIDQRQFEMAKCVPEVWKAF